MDYNSSRLFALTLAHRAIGDVKKDGFRQLRNYVDMCAVLAKGPMQQSFFERAQAALTKTSSLYYSLISQMLSTVDEERICTVGVNLGLGSLVYCAGKMKLQAEKDHQPFSWMTTALAEDAGLEDAIKAGEEAGAYSWAVYAPQGITEALLALAKRHPLCVFFLLVPPETMTEAVCERMNGRNNIVPILQLAAPELSEEANEATEVMRVHRLFYSFLVQLDDETAPTALHPEWLDVLSRHGIVCVYTRKSGMNPTVSDELRKNIYRNRQELGAPMLLIDWENDIAVINEHISAYAVPGSRIPADVNTPLNG